MGLSITAAVWRLAGAIKATLAAGEDPYDGEALMSHMFNTEWLNRKCYNSLRTVCWQINNNNEKSNCSDYHYKSPVRKVIYILMPHCKNSKVTAIDKFQKFRVSKL